MNSHVRQLYKTLLYMGKEYPEKLGGYAKFRKVLKKNFQSTPISNPQELKEALNKGKFVEKGR